MRLSEWEYWLKDELKQQDKHTDSSTVYKSPLTKEDIDDIHHFVRDMSISIYSGPKDMDDRANKIVELATGQYYNKFQELSSFTHFYFFFEFSPEKPILLDELAEIMMKLLKLVQGENSEPKYYFFGVETCEETANALHVKIQAGKL
ncbi:MAG: hypothetical protein LLF81_02495 [Porphyromonadaceae bacterium]|nr:hypothetical protein [Porphyromonadaceae bacterium]